MPPCKDNISCISFYLINLGLEKWGFEMETNSEGEGAAHFISSRGKLFRSIPQYPDGFWGPSSNVYGCSFPRLKLSGLEADLSFLSSAEVKKSGAMPPLSTRLHGVVLVCLIN
jgi:hypothetical protein